MSIEGERGYCRAKISRDFTFVRLRPFSCTPPKGSWHSGTVTTVENDEMSTESKTRLVSTYKDGSVIVNL